jgi:hypothetical protein
MLGEEHVVVVAKRQRIGDEAHAEGDPDDG